MKGENLSESQFLFSIPGKPEKLVLLGDSQGTCLVPQQAR